MLSFHLFYGEFWCYFVKNEMCSVTVIYVKFPNDYHVVFYCYKLAIQGEQKCHYSCSASVPEVTWLRNGAVCVASLLLVPDECWHPVPERLPASTSRDCPVNAEETDAP